MLLSRADLVVMNGKRILDWRVNGLSDVQDGPRLPTVNRCGMFSHLVRMVCLFSRPFKGHAEGLLWVLLITWFVFLTHGVL